VCADPFDLGDKDDRLWAALEQVRLKDHIDGLDGKLDAPVAEFGANFSVGQKQLICMARALVRNNKILVMDEATSSVDMDTDQVIQQVIKSRRTCSVDTLRSLYASCMKMRIGSWP
jgi:ABC-type multidrug transport system fused ATPase/permease subunit